MYSSKEGPYCELQERLFNNIGNTHSAESLILIYGGYVGYGSYLLAEDNALALVLTQENLKVRNCTYVS